ncbi:sensor histidine kinase [Amycolatopsis magusensis]|uniref:sensor histidine kinase n=1 Tax=Amycolatopsis magusensis TaxID=882444 RepID=UPI003C2E3473
MSQRVPVRLAIGFALAAFCVAATLSAPAGRPVRPLDLTGIALLVVPALVAGWTSAALRPVLALTSVSAVAFYALGYASIFAPAPVTVAVFTAVLSGRTRAAWVTAAVTCAGAYAAGLGHGLSAGAAALGPGWIAGWLVAAAAGGEVLRQRRQAWAHERLRAAQQERLRIARELHDSLTHSISVINVQASVAEHLGDRDPAALAVIRAASADALRELRATVGVLRQDQPGPGLARLAGLADRARATGMDLTVRAAPADLPPDVDRAAYRVVQEALANAARHAPGAPVRITVAREKRALRVTVDNGPATASATTTGGGTGLTGLRERASGLGANLHAGPHGDGFRVRATFPLEHP